MENYCAPGHTSAANHVACRRAATTITRWPTGTRNHFALDVVCTDAFTNGVELLLPGRPPRERLSHEGEGPALVTGSGPSCPARARTSCARLVISSLRKTFTR